MVRVLENSCMTCYPTSQSPKGIIIPLDPSLSAPKSYSKHCLRRSQSMGHGPSRLIPSRHPTAMQLLCPAWESRSPCSCRQGKTSWPSNWGVGTGGKTKHWIHDIWYMYVDSINDAYKYIIIYIYICYSIIFYVTSFLLLYHIICIVSYHIIFYCIISYDNTLHYMMFYHIILYHIIYNVHIYIYMY